MKIEWTEPSISDLQHIRDYLAIIHGSRDLSIIETKPWEII